MPRKRSVETESRIAEGATRLFCTAGYANTTMAAIAEAAGVSVQTLYLRHGSKAAILSAALDVAIVGDTDPVAVLEREDNFYARALAASDAAKAIGIWVEGVRQICDRTHGLYAVIRSAASDPEVAAVLEQNRTGRLDGHRVLAESLSKKKRYNSAVPAQQAADVMYAIGTEDSYLLFVVDCGWTSDAWERWVVETVSAQLIVGKA